ncbi:hypothetical protein F2Q69_00034215 [Brassica cretica]|uniref:Uncharacterized protein n=1 Tax=Brassica cretica TaxID=69181 RepID=A0A8S9SAN8_BRACR|nr:hypothetical protein F2Q69_00034215 [Brassica cretica]
MRVILLQGGLRLLKILKKINKRKFFERFTVTPPLRATPGLLIMPHCPMRSSVAGDGG